MPASQRSTRKPPAPYLIPPTGAPSHAAMVHLTAILLREALARVGAKAVRS
jgi:hypothetical protein